MKCFQILTALAVIACVSVASADNLPPVPKTTKILVVKTEPTPAPPKSEATATISTEIAKTEIAEIKPVAEAPMPPVPSASGSVQPCKSCQSEAEKMACAAKVASQDIKGQVRVGTYVVGTSVKFLTNELVRKPIYDVRQIAYDLEGKRLEAEACRLQCEARCLACQAERLAAKAAKVCPNDLHAQLKMLKEQREFATKANNLAVRKAALEVKQAEHKERKERLDGVRADLFPSAD